MNCGTEGENVFRPSHHEMFVCTIIIIIIMNPFIIESTSSKAVATLIFLHGLGDTGKGWASAMKYLAPSLGHVRFVLPTAPTRPVTINGNMPMPAWYDIYSLSPVDHRTDEAGISQSQAQITDLVETERQAGRKVFVGGFSQGAVVALQVGLQNSGVSGIVALSGYYALPNSVIRNQEVPIFMAHGTKDIVVQYAWGQKSAEALKSKGCKVQFQSYAGMAHESSMEELEDVKLFILEQLKEKNEL